MIIQKYRILYESKPGQGKTSLIEFAKTEKTLADVEAERDAEYPGGEISEVQELVEE